VNTSPGSDEIVSIQQVADMTGLAVQTLYNLRSRGEGPRSFTLRRRVRYYRADVTSWIETAAGRSNVTPLRTAPQYLQTAGAV
jgi:predicted DNA-binding transcriptional regulator AlpA